MDLTVILSYSDFNDITTSVKPHLQGSLFHSHHRSFPENKIYTDFT